MNHLSALLFSAIALTSGQVIAGASADLSITKTDGVTSVTPGGNATYTIVASNAGPSGAPVNLVSDTFPAALTCTWTCAGAGGGTCTASGSGNIADTTNLPVGASVTYTATCTISGAATGTISNTATVADAGKGPTDPVPGNNSATDVDTVGTSNDLTITKTDNATSVAPGGSLTYTIVAGNSGPQGASGAVVDNFPAECSNVTWTCVGAGGGTCTASGTGNISQVVTLPVSATTTFTAICVVNPATANGTVISNTATHQVYSGGTDPVPGNNSATDTTTVAVALADVDASKSVDGTFAPNGAITYTIVLNNFGAGAQPDNAGNEFVDVLPAGVTLVSASATSGTAVATVGTNTVSWNGAIPAAGTVTITINATVNANATGEIANQGNVSFDGDGNGSNETTRPTDDPETKDSDDPTSFTVAAGGTAIVIPAAGLWGLMILGLLMLGVGLQRRRA
jgi:uncharacterized repeat protein (TIGR01451 family)